MSQIHPTALIDPAAQLHPSVSVGAYTVIGPNVVVGEDTQIGPHCLIEGHTTLGKHNRIFSHVSLGAAPQDKKYAGEPTRLTLGDDNTVREFCTFNTGTVSGGGETRVGDDNLFMAYVHLAHDCHIGSHTIFANNSQLAGHVQVGDWVILGGFTVIRQFIRLGDHSFTAMCSLLFADLPPFVTCQGQPADARTINAEGLRRRGFSAERIAVIRKMYKLMYRQGLTLEASREAMQALRATSPHAQADIDAMLGFLSGMRPKVGIVRGRSTSSAE